MLCGLNGRAGHSITAVSCVWQEEVRGIFYCSGNLFPDSGNTLLVFCLLLTKASSHWNLDTDAAISSATLLLLFHKQEMSPTALVLIIFFACKYKGANCSAIETMRRACPHNTYPDV